MSFLSKSLKATKQRHRGIEGKKINIQHDLLCGAYQIRLQLNARFRHGSSRPINPHVYMDWYDSFGWIHSLKKGSSFILPTTTKSIRLNLWHLLRHHKSPLVQFPKRQNIKTYETNFAEISSTKDFV